MPFHTFIQQVADSVVHPSGDYVLLQTSIRQFCWDPRYNISLLGLQSKMRQVGRKCRVPNLGWKICQITHWSSWDPWGGTGDRQTAALNAGWLKWTEREMILKCIVCSLPGLIYFSIIFGCAQRHLGVNEINQAAGTCSFLRNYRLFLKSTGASHFLVSQNPLTGRIVCCTRKAKCIPGSCTEPLNCAKPSLLFNIKFRECFC